MEDRLVDGYDADYADARNKVLLHSILARLTGHSNRLLSFNEVKDKLHLGGPVYRGQQAVPVSKIVGSVNRYEDFDRTFMPKRGASAWRWRAINRAFYHYEDLPPVQLYKVGEVYFVVDGHHRVSVAREHGVEFIDADVTEVASRVPLTPDVDAADLEVLGEYETFLERTQLDALRPEQNIRFSSAGGYDRLLEHVAVHRYFMGLDEKREVGEAEAVTHWYDTVYSPIVQIIRQHDALDDFPGRTEADLYLWLMDHIHYLRESHQQLDLEEAAAEFAAKYSERPVRKLLRGVAHTIEAIGGTEGPGLAPPPNLEAV